MGIFSFIGELFGFGGGKPQRIDVVKIPTGVGLPILYGRRKVTPINVFKCVSRDNAAIAEANFDQVLTHGRDDGSEKVQDEYKWLHRIGVWGQGEIDGIEHFWVDGDSYLNRRFNPKPFFRAASKYGAPGQQPITELNAASRGKWTSAQRGEGIAYSWLRFFNSEEDPQYNADPRIEARIRGRKLWDPRLGDEDDTAATVYSANRALVLLDYLMAEYGAGLRLDELDIESFKTGADLCDEAQPLPSGAVQPKYQCHANLNPKDGVVTNIKKLLTGVGWAMPWSNGRLKLVLEQAVEAPAAVFGENEILGGWSVARGGRQGRLNRVTIEFPNAAKDYEQDTASWPVIDSPVHRELKLEDQGQDLHENETVDTITNFYEAQLYAQYLVRKSRAPIKVHSVRLSPAALVLEPGDVIGLNDSFQGFHYSGDEPELQGTGRWFIVDKVTISPTLEVTLALTDYDAKLYGLDDPDDEPIVDDDGNPNLLARPEPLENLQASERHETVTSGTVLSGAEVSWDRPTETAGLLETRLAWREIPASGEPGGYTQQMRLSPETTRAYVTGLVDDRTYEFRASYVTLNGRESLPATCLLDLSAQEGSLTQVLSDQRAPLPDEGQLGWTFIDLSTGDVYTKTGSGWGSPIANLRGDDGDKWYSGDTVPDAALAASHGATVGDYYLFTVNGDVFQLLGESWTVVANIRGTNGQNTATLYLYQRSQAAPVSPTSAMNYQFSTAAFSGVSEGWRIQIPAGNDPLWVITATATSEADIATVAPADWSSPAVMAQNGVDAAPRYTWIAYANNASGSGFTTGAPGSRTYVGIASNQESDSESQDWRDYVWSKWSGPTTLEDLRGVTGWSSIPENGATRNTGDLADLDRITTNYISNNAVTGYGESIDDGGGADVISERTLGSGWVNVTSIWVPADNEGPILLFARLDYELLKNDGIGRTIQMRARRGGNFTVGQAWMAAPETGSILLMTSDPDANLDGNVLYTLQVRAPNGVLPEFVGQAFAFYGWEQKR